MVSLLGLSSLSAWSGISSLHFPFEFQWGQTQKCPHFLSSHQMTLSSYFEATRQTPSAFPGCWEGAGRHCSRGSVKSSSLFARHPHRMGSEPAVTDLSEWWKGNHCCLPDKISLWWWGIKVGLSLYSLMQETNQTKIRDLGSGGRCLQPSLTPNKQSEP